MELFKIFETYLNLLHEQYSRTSGNRRYSGKVRFIEVKEGHMIVGVKFSGNVKFQNSEPIVFAGEDGLVESFEDGIYYFRLRKDSAVYENMVAEVTSASDLLFLVENMIKVIDDIQSKEPLSEYKDLIKNLYDKKGVGDLTKGTSKDWMVTSKSNNSNKQFTESQNKVISTALELLKKEKGIIPVEGPGGTGKTECIAEIARQCIKEGKRILICSATNLAIDNVLSKLLDQESVVRLGSEGSIERAEVRALSVKNQLDNKFNQQEIINDAKVIGSTIDSAGIHLKQQTFDLVVIDEASTVELPKLLIAITKSKRVMICGDTKQITQFIDYWMLKRLSDIISQEDIKTLLMSPFQLISDQWDESSRTLYLLDNFRNPRKIFEFINKTFYENRMICRSERQFEKRKPKRLQEIATADELSWIIPHRSELEVGNEGVFDPIKLERKFGNSYINRGNIAINMLMLRELLKHHKPEDIGIITPFNAQVSMIKEFILTHPGYLTGADCKTELKRLKLGFYLINAININTINKFQGQERDIILFDVTSNADFVFDDARKINVVLGRAKQQIIIIGLPPRNPKCIKLFESAYVFGDVDMADMSLAFAMNNEDVNEFNRLLTIVEALKNADFSAKDLEEHFGKLLTKSFAGDLKYKDQIKTFMLGKKLADIVSVTLRTFFSAGSLDPKKYDLLEKDIAQKLEKEIKMKKLGPLFGYSSQENY